MFELVYQIFIIFLLILGVPISHNTTALHDALYVATLHHKSYDYNYIYLHVKVDGKPIWMILDTGTWISGINGPDVHRLGLDDDTLSPSKMGINTSSILPDGTKQTLKVADVVISINGSQPFRTTVTIDPKNTDFSLLSLHDFIQAYHGIDFKSCRFVETVHNTTWSACPQ